MIPHRSAGGSHYCSHCMRGAAVPGARANAYQADGDTGVTRLRGHHTIFHCQPRWSCSVWPSFDWCLSWSIILMSVIILTGLRRFIGTRIVLLHPTQHPDYRPSTPAPTWQEDNRSLTSSSVEKRRKQKCIVMWCNYSEIPLWYLFKHEIWLNCVNMKWMIRKWMKMEILIYRNIKKS